MATYIMLTRLTDKGAETIKKNPPRIEAVSKELEKFGVKVVAQYAVLGPFDFVNILEAPDNMTVARVSAELALDVEEEALHPVGDFLLAGVVLEPAGEDVLVAGGLDETRVLLEGRLEVAADAPACLPLE